MAFAYLTGATGGGISTATSSAINTTGATLIVIGVSASGTTLADLNIVSDSAGNSWVLCGATAATSQGLTIWYCVSPATSASHTFSATLGTAPGIAVMAFSGTCPKPAKWVRAYSSSSVTTCQPGTLTPATDNSLIVNVAGLFAGTSITINGGYTAITRDFVGGVSLAVGMAYLIQATATASNPTWSWTSAGQWAAAQVVFMEQAGSSGGLQVMRSMGGGITQ